MSLKAVQEVLARLYVDSELRRQFFDNPTEIGQKLGLTAAETQQLRELRSPQIDFFARSLHRKRLNAVRGLLPFSPKLLDSHFSPIFSQYAEIYTPSGIKKHQDDAVMFCNFLASENHLDPPWIGDIANYEKGWLLTAKPDFRWHSCHFRYDIAPFVQSGSQDLQKKSAIAIWVRFSPTAKTRYFYLPWF
ncbi:MAG: hypothetical protein ACLFT0_11790 [Spirulinaceae cyanobacterium]